ncbi:hypothetical protein HQ447_07340 [bacterium]|nr:hypothetical protein [bacterium]
MSDLISESASLRKCNLADTPQWRNWIRSQLPSQEISTGRIYDRCLVDLLASKIADFARATNPPEEQRETVTFGHSGPVDSGIGRKRGQMPLTDRGAPQLHSR